MNEYSEMIEKALDEFLIKDNDVKGLVDSMEYSLMAGGKRIRPKLVLEFCKACGGNPENALSFACAIEMIHTYSLIHDDLHQTIVRLEKIPLSWQVTHCSL